MLHFIKYITKTFQLFYSNPCKKIHTSGEKNMKMNFKKIVGLLTITALMMLPVSAFAASKSFTFDMEHQLYIGKYKSTKESVTATVNMKSWGGDDYFTIHIYETVNGSAILRDKIAFSKSSAGSPYTEISPAVKKDHTYSYEIWKNRNYKVIKGACSLSY